jgi:hypothetical protein
MENSNENTVKVDLQQLADQVNAEQAEVHKVDLSAPQEEKSVVDELIEDIQNEDINQENLEEDAKEEELRVQPQEEAVEENSEEELNDSQEEEILEELTDEDENLESVIDELVTESKTESATPNLPESIKKLMAFMEETGGDLEDYTKLNVDVSKFTDEELLKQYHADQEPDLTPEEVAFLVEDMYSTDEYEEDDRELKKKTIAKKRAVSKAKAHFESRKEKYYSEIKGGSKLLPEQQKAVDFFNRYQKTQEQESLVREKQSKVFTQKTGEVFNQNFKGFEFKVGDKRYRYNVKDVDAVKNAQANLENFTKKFLGDDNTLSDAKGYHKALFTAMNADAIADHFYKQGRADAIKNSDATKKNISMGPRKTHDSANAPQSGFRAKVVDSGTSIRPGKLTIRK